MSKSRIYVKDLQKKPNAFILSKENTKIVRSVLRLKKGEELEIIDGYGSLAKAAVEKFGKDGCHLKVLRKSTFSKDLPVKITLIQAFPKGKRMDIVLQKATELGIDKMIFFPAKRSVSVIKKKDFVSKIKRFEKIAIEALRQCRRLYIPGIILNSSITACMEETRSSDLKLCLHEHESGTRIKPWLKQFDSPKDIVFAIGPEGGFNDNEVITFVTEGFKQVKLGDEVLRTETAPMTVLSILNYQYRW